MSDQLDTKTGWLSPDQLENIRANVPLGQMFGYATDVRSMTQGRATYTMQFARYEEVPPAIEEEITAKAAGKPVKRDNTR